MPKDDLSTGELGEHMLDVIDRYSSRIAGHIEMLEAADCPAKERRSVQRQLAKWERHVDRSRDYLTLVVKQVNEIA
jgi:hypothetical protein